MRDDSGEAEVLHQGPAIPDGAWVQVEGRASEGRMLAQHVQVVSVGPELGTEGLLSSSEFALRRRRRTQRDVLLRCLRQGFEARAFIEVETPSLLDAPGQEPHLEPFETEWCGQPLWLATSPEYAMKRLLVEGADRIYQLGRSFRSGRDEQSHWHQPEFTLLEWYRAFESLEALREDLHWLGATAARAVTGGTVVARAGLFCDLALEPRWLSVERAFTDYAGVDLEPYLDGAHASFLSSLGLDPAAESDLPEAADREFSRVLIDRIEPRLGCGRPTLLVDYPARHAALAELSPEDPRVARRFELYVTGVELANAFQELRDPVEQERRLREENEVRARRDGVRLPIDERFLHALRVGLPPSVGIALGVDRLLTLLCGARSIDEVVCEPRSSASRV